MMNIVKVTLPEKCRIICVSDIHAHYDEFAKLLRKCGYDKESDYLFILGDILEKGRQNIETLHFIQKLSRDKNAYVSRVTMIQWYRVWRLTMKRKSFSKGLHTAL